LLLVNVNVNACQQSPALLYIVVCVVGVGLFQNLDVYVCENQTTTNSLSIVADTSRLKKKNEEGS
jgi:hypothetical protein